MWSRSKFCTTKPQCPSKLGFFFSLCSCSESFKLAAVGIHFQISHTLSHCRHVCYRNNRHPHPYDYHPPPEPLLHMRKSLAIRFLGGFHRQISAFGRWRAPGTYWSHPQAYQVQAVDSHPKLCIPTMPTISAFSIETYRYWT